VTILRFLVVADSHIRFPDDDIATYPSNALMIDRNRRVVEMCNDLDAAFVVHLGDIVHPLPVEDAHSSAVQLAAELYSDLNIPIHFVAGNHDVGDKPDAMVAVPAVAEDNYGIFEHYWGSSYRSFDVDTCHFVILDTPVLNSGLEREAAQRAWVEQDLAKAAAEGQRIFVFTHYPPFVRTADEDEHYDNLGEPARDWLLGLLEQHDIEAVFSGHVHNFLYNRHGGTDMYVLPSTGFVRPDYSELAAIAPESEWGRDDPAKLGFFVVEVDEDEHRVRPVRTHGAVDCGAPLPALVDEVVAAGWRCPVGVTIRHGWMSSVDFPTSGLDEFRRKTVRNDSVLPALWESRIEQLRVPVADIADSAQLARLHHLQDRGMAFTVRSAGVPDERTVTRVRAAIDVLHRWEIVLWPHQYESALRSLVAAAVDVPIAVAPVVPLGEGEVHHFVTSGFASSDSAAVAVLAAADSAGLIAEFVFRIPPESEVAAALDAVAEVAALHGRGAVAVAELPRGAEATISDDDLALADWVEAVVRAAAAQPDVAVFVDGFVDHDRSYYPHIGLVDRRFNPRPALERLIMTSAQTG
jgi:predicted phosphodiesterase